MTTTDSRTRSLIDVDVLEYHRLLTPEQQEELTEIRAALAEIVTPHVAEAWSRDEFPHEIARRVGAIKPRCLHDGAAGWLTGLRQAA